MKKIIVSLLAAVALISCDHDDTPVNKTGSVSFVVNGTGPGAGRMQDLAPQKVVVSVEDKDGKVVLDNKVFTLSSKDRAYQTDLLPFAVGEYKVTKYLVISGTTAAYATPRTGAEKANLIDKPLPFSFNVVASQDNSVAPMIIGISAHDTPQLFGYADFGYDLPGSETPEWYHVRVKLELTLGGIYYPNIDARFLVKGFDANNSVVWMDDYDYVGPEPNDLKIKDGFHHYSIEASKWGTTLSQTYTGTSLFERRIKQGEVPITQVFQTDVTPRKLASSTTFWSQKVDGETVMTPISKANYEYKVDGRISSIEYFTWSEADQEFIVSSESLFDYDGNRLSRILGYTSDSEQLNAEDVYTYDDQGNVTNIQHKGEGITTNVDIERLFDGRVIRANYRSSNGTSFQYEFVTQHGNVTSDKTTRGSQLCSEAQYTSDKHINPLKHLGYTDFLMRNNSVSNRLTENANYIGCAFPSLVTDYYSYVYDEHGYPLRATTHFKGTEAKTEVQYTYMQQ